MAYNTKEIVKDVEGNPISQYYNPDTDSYEPVEGQAGANKVVLYNADGTENNELSLIPILEKLSQLTGTVIDEETRKTNETTRQSNEQLRVQLYNDLMAQLDRIEQIQEQVPETVVDSINDIRDKLGDLTLLDTAEKSNLVLALNEIYNDLVAHKAENAKFERINLYNEDYMTKGAVQRYQRKISADDLVGAGWLRIAEQENGSAQIMDNEINISLNGGALHFGLCSLSFISYQKYKSLKLINSIKASNRTMKIRLVDPDTNHTIGNFIDIYYDNWEGISTIFLEIVFKNVWIASGQLTTMKCLENPIFNPEIPVGYRITEVEL